MTFIWLLVWLFSSTPSFTWPDSWAIGLLVCVIVDVLGSFGKISGRIRR